jgi:hypothetical protein
VQVAAASGKAHKIRISRSIYQAKRLHSLAQSSRTCNKSNYLIFIIPHNAQQSRLKTPHKKTVNN